MRSRLSGFDSVTSINDKQYRSVFYRSAGAVLYSSHGTQSLLIYYRVSREFAPTRNFDSFLFGILFVFYSFKIPLSIVIAYDNTVVSVVSDRFTAFLLYYHVVFMSQCQKYCTLSVSLSTPIPLPIPCSTQLIGDDLQQKKQFWP